jgi:hypothetical protein
MPVVFFKKDNGYSFGFSFSGTGYIGFSIGLMDTRLIKG